MSCTIHSVTDVIRHKKRKKCSKCKTTQNNGGRVTASRLGPSDDTASTLWTGRGRHTRKRVLWHLSFWWNSGFFAHFWSCVITEHRMGPVRIRHSPYENATQPVILWIAQGAKPKWLPLIQSELLLRNHCYFFFSQYQQPVFKNTTFQQGCPSHFQVTWKPVPYDPVHKVLESGWGNLAETYFENWLLVMWEEEVGFHWIWTSWH